MFQIQSFTCEGLRDHLVTDCAAPTFAYFVSSDRAGASIQSAELTVNGWTIRNPDQCGTRYAGQPLKPFTTYTATLTVTSDSGETDTARLTFETGRMDTPWQGKWITDGAYVFKEKKVSPVPMVFRKALPLRGEIAQAKLYATAMGIYELNIDGQKVGERYFAPGFTSYAHQLMYQTYDVTDMLHSGSCITATVAGGWAVGSFVFTRVNRVTADRQALLAELRITYRDGRTEVIGTDESWQVTEDGPVRMADFYDGETYDATISLDKANWRSAVQERLRVKPKLMADYGADVKEHEKFAPVSCKKLGNALIYDFGQNFAGVVRLTVTGKRGQKITIRHSEVLNPDGTLNTAFLRTAKATATYICKDGKQTWSPRLTYMGFRYISVEGVREEDVQVTGVMLYSDIQQTGSFRCSNEMLNRLQENIVRSAKSNFMDIPTDCPQRDERMAWMNDATVRFEETPYNFDVSRIFPKIMLDIHNEQRAEGQFACCSPYIYGGLPADPVCSSYLMAGKQALMHCGELNAVDELFDGMAAWEDFLLSHSPDGTVDYSYYGDWAAPGYACIGGEEGATNAETPGVLMSTGYSYFNCVTLADFARRTGRHAAESKYRAAAARVRDAFLAKWFDPATARVATGSMGAQAFALWLGILPPESEAAAARLMRDDLVNRDYRFTTGNLCTRYLLDMLAKFGYADEAYTLLTRDTYPSFGFMIQNEATTVWERFELKKNPNMNSHNHPMYGAVGSWFYQYLAGITPTAPGFAEMTIKPVFPSALLSAHAVVDTVMGEVSVRWAKRYGKLFLFVQLPFGSVAHLDFNGTQTTLRGGYHVFEKTL